MIEAWRAIGRASGLVLAVVATIYLATASERMLGDFRDRAAAARADARECLARPGMEPSYAELVRLETRIFQGDAARCRPPRAVPIGSRAGGTT